MCRNNDCTGRYAGAWCARLWRNVIFALVLTTSWAIGQVPPSLLLPHPVRISGIVVDADGKPLSKSAARDCYLQRVPEHSSAFRTLRFGVGPKNESDLYSNWLQNA